MLADVPAAARPSVKDLEGGAMVVVVFRARLKGGIGKDYEETDARMAALAGIRRFPACPRLSHLHRRRAGCAGAAAALPTV